MLPMLLLAAVSTPAASTELSKAREQALVRLVRQDCGSCHGMQLTGGLGPALTPSSLADKSVDGLTATIFQGRAGTPMPGWRPMITEAEAKWMAQRLLAGFPEEEGRRP